MKTYKLKIRILDADPVRLMGAYKNVNEVMRAYAIEAQVIAIDEHLEIYRMGLSEKMPAMEVNGHVLTVRKRLTKDLLLEIFKPLTAPGKGSVANNKK